MSTAVERRMIFHLASKQESRDQGTDGRWNFRLFGEVNAWMNHGHGEITVYLHRMRKIGSPRCANSTEDDGDAHHSLLGKKISQRTREHVSKSVMEDPWKNLSAFAHVFRHLKREEGCLTEPSGYMRKKTARHEVVLKNDPNLNSCSPY
ncbi:hypothetical protein J6590_041604 [Homalodisca vitripennis]|nr:hypothetical protein J6590_041604 [Homalodisca vitripennis]